MANELTDSDRATITSCWVGYAFGAGGSRSLQSAAERTYLAGKAAGIAEERELWVDWLETLERIYEAAPGLPLELATPEELSKWTDALTSFGINLGLARHHVDSALKASA